MCSKRIWAASDHARGSDGRLLEVRDLHVAYGKVEAVHDVSLQVAAGRIVTVIGPNGAGKTTLLAALMGLLPPRGDVLCDGGDHGELTVEQRVARGLILVPERRELFAAMSVADNLELGAFQRVRRGDRSVGATLDEVYAALPAPHGAPRRSSRARCPAASGRCWRWVAR